MLKLRKAEDRGIYDYGWLYTQHSFSFGNYYDPEFLGFRDLIVINQDIIDPGTGFSAHSHNNMEILSYVIAGGLEHKDSMGNSYVINEGDFQIMSAGTGITHSEHNASKTEKGEFLQIWIKPNIRNLVPSYQQKQINNLNDGLNLIASNEDNQYIFKINQDVKIFMLKSEKSNHFEYTLGSRFGWFQLVKGMVTINKTELHPGDGIAISDEDILSIEVNDNTLGLFFDLV